MDPTSAGNDATATHTVGGRPVNTDGHRGHPLKKPSFGRDARLVQDGALAKDGAWLMTGPFHPPNEPPVFLLCCHCRVICIWCFCLSRSASDNNNDATQGGGGGGTREYKEGGATLTSKDIVCCTNMPGQRLVRWRWWGRRMTTTRKRRRRSWSRGGGEQRQLLSLYLIKKYPVSDALIRIGLSRDGCACRNFTLSLPASF